MPFQAIPFLKALCATLGIGLTTIAGAAPPTRDGDALAFRSRDGLVLDPSPARVLTNIREPDVLLLTKATPSRNGPDAGHLLCFAVTAALRPPGQSDGSRGLVRSVSIDQGRSWAPHDPVAIRGWPKELEGFNPAAPAAVQLEDARIRLYFTATKPATPTLHPDDFSPLTPRRPGQSDTPPARVYSAISNDGLQFAIEDGHRFELANISDAEVLRLPNLLPGDIDDRKIGPWLLFFTRADSTFLATSRDGLTFTRDDTFNLPSLRHATATVLAPDSRKLRLYGRDATGLVSALFDPATGDLKPDPGTRFKADADDPTAALTGDGATLLVLVQKSTDKPDQPVPSPALPTPPIPELTPPSTPKRPLDPRFPPDFPAPPTTPDPK